jgi:hypothetical protein
VLREAIHDALQALASLWDDHKEGDNYKEGAELACLPKRPWQRRESVASNSATRTGRERCKGAAVVPKVLRA